MKDVLSEIKMSSVIPSNVQDFSEASIYCIEAMNDDYNALMEEADLLNESAEAEEAITEADASALKEKFVGFLQGLWAKVKEFFAKAFNFFKEACQKAIETVSKKASELVEKGKEKAAEKIEKIVSGEVVDAALKSNAEISLATFELKNLLGMEGNGFPKAEEVNGVDDAKKIDAIPALFVKDAKSTSEMKDLYKKGVKLESKNVKLSDIKKEEVFAAVETIRKNTVGDQIKKAYNETRNVFKKAIDDAKKNSKEVDKQFKPILSAKINYCRRYLQCLQTINAASMELLREKFAQDVRLIIKVYSVGKKELAKAAKAKADAEKAQAQKESVFEW